MPAVCLASLAALAASAAAPARTAVCTVHGPRWARTDTHVHGSLYEVGYANVGCGFAARWARKVAADVATFGSLLPGGPPGFQCRNLGDTKGPTNVSGTVLVGSCSDGSGGKSFAWKAHGY
jgi:hypothetical protein